MSSTSPIVDRIRKLFALATSPEPNEAANALKLARRLMRQHRIEQADLDAVDDEEIQLYDDEPLETGTAIPPWKQAVGGAIAELNDCLCLVSDSRLGPRQLRSMVIAGRRDDFEECVAMYRWIVGTVDRAAVFHSGRIARRYHNGSGLGRRWLNSFRHGAGAELEERLAQEGREQQAQLVASPKTSTALAINHDAVHDWAEENIDTRDARGRTADVDLEAFELGAQLGRSMSLRDSGGAK